jgi:hypothetical protein
MGGVIYKVDDDKTVILYSPEISASNLPNRLYVFPPREIDSYLPKRPVPRNTSSPSGSVISTLIGEPRKKFSGSYQISYLPFDR